MSHATIERQEYRCCIAAENSAGKLKIGLRTFDVCVTNTSRTGFGIRMPTHVAKKLSSKRRLLLLYAGETWEVGVQSRYSDDSQFTNLGLIRGRELTKLQVPGSWWGGMFSRSSAPADPTFLAFLVLAFLIAVISLPGIGDSLGTAPKVRKALSSLLD